MAKISRLDFSREKQILINLILNSKYCAAIIPVLNREYFRSEYAKTVAKWVSDYYTEYRVAPKEHIEEIYHDHAKVLDDPTYEHIGLLLQHLSDVSDSNVHNVEYLIDVADDFFKERHLELQKTAMEAALSDGNLLEAERITQNKYESVKEHSRDFIRFDDAEFVRKCVRGMVQKLDDTEAFFRFFGRLGDFIGPLERQWLVAFMAPAKRGKTTYMLDAVISSIYQRKNTVVLSLEMPEKQLMSRYYLAITGLYPEVPEYERMVPLMDCLHNQTGECDLSERCGNGTVMIDGKLIDYYEAEDWLRCEACRGTKKFMPAAWKEPQIKPYISEGDYLKRASSFNRHFGKYGRIIHAPSKSVTVADLREMVASLRERENFVADVIVLDYADLVKPAIGSGIKRHDLDDIWEELRAWEQEEHILLITASQTNRVSADAKYIKDTHVAEDYSKIAKLDVGIGLCQTDAMKEVGMMNINIVAHRHKGYVQSNVCTVLQDMELQQSSLDSEFVSF